MTKPKKFPYQIHYTDNTSRIIDWTKAEFQKVTDAMVASLEVSCTEDGIFRLNDVRAIVALQENKTINETEDTNQPQPEPQLTEWGFVDAETAKWLKANGIDLSKGVN